MSAFQKPLFLLILLLSSTAAIVTACAPRLPQQTGSTITVMAAASLTSAFQEIGERFEQQNPGVNVVFNFAGSQQLAQQLAQGAAADVFASANRRQMEVVAESGRIEPDAYRIFARNQLVIIVPRENPGALTEWRDLAKPGIKLVFAAREVPVGQYSLDFLRKASQNSAAGPAFQESVEESIVSYEDTVKAVLTKVALGEADAGIVYTSDVTGSAAEQIEQISIPGDLNVIASYPIGMMNDSPHPQLAQAFVEFVHSQQGQDILAKHGFLPAGK